MTQSENTKRAIIYTRTDVGPWEKQHQGHQIQLEACRALVKEHGFKTVGWFLDWGPMTGLDGDAAQATWNGLGGLVTLVERGGAEAIIVRDERVLFQGTADSETFYAFQEAHVELLAGTGARFSWSQSC